MDEEEIRDDLEGTWSNVIEIKDDDGGYRISLEFDGSERQFRNWLPDEYTVIDTVDVDGRIRAMIRVD